MRLVDVGRLVRNCSKSLKYNFFYLSEKNLITCDMLVNIIAGLEYGVISIFIRVCSQGYERDAISVCYAL